MYPMEKYYVNEIDNELEYNLLNGILRPAKSVKLETFVTVQFYMYVCIHVMEEQSSRIFEFVG